MNSRLSRTYARALFLAARDRDCVTSVLEQLQPLAEPLEGDLGRFLLSTSQSKASINKLTAELIRELFPDQDTELLVNLLQLTVEKGRTRLLPEIVQEYATLCDEEQGLERGQLKVAGTLSPELLAQLETGVSQWRGHNVKLEQEQDPDLIGGFVIRLSGRDGSAQIDASLRSTLQQLRNRLLAD
jgi:F-type H+-transporting ATPase subunit delta